MSAQFPTLDLSKCGECGENFYGAHLSKCSREEDLETCGECGEFYIARIDSAFPLSCACKSKVVAL